MAEESSKNQIKLLVTGLVIIFGLVIIMAITAWSAIYVCYSNEIKTVKSVHKISDRPVVEINYTGDYKFKEYLRHGSNSITETNQFLEHNLCRGFENFISENYKCSAFFAQTPNGDYILARNMDYDGSTFPAILKMNAEQSIRSLGISSVNQGKAENGEAVYDKFEAIYTPYQTYDGMNEYGLAVAAISTANSYSVSEKNKITIYDIELVRLLLDQAQSVSEAERLITNYNVALSKEYPSHFIVCDGEGNAIVIEYVKGSLQVTKRQKNYQIITDFLLYSGEKQSDKGAAIYKQYEKNLSGTDGVISMEDAMELLKENTEDCVSQWSVVYNLTKKYMKVSFSDDNGKVYEYSFNE